MLFFAFFGFRSHGKVEMGFGVLYNKGRRRASPAQGGTGLFERFQTVAGALMRDYTTLRLGGPADWLVTPRSAGELIQILAEARERGLPVTVIGQGSNLVVRDGGIRGLVIRMARGLRACFVQGNLLTADAGAMMGAAAAAAAEAGLSGLEFASGIPGTVGGGALMNAGAYGGEMSQVVQQVTVVRRDGTIAVKTAAEMEYGYRHSALQASDEIITQVVFRLRDGDPREIRARMAELNRQRAEKQPLDVPSAGSTFKRPEGAFAAALIDQCGLKGYAVGGAMVSPKHAGFLVNRGSSAADYLALMAAVQQIVEERTGIRLEPEVRILGEDPRDSQEDGNQE